MAQFVDWDLAAATAGALGKSGPTVSYDEATAVVADLRQLTDEAAGHVAAYTGLRSQVAHPPVRVVDRRDWAAANIAGLREVITPLVSRLSGDKQPGAISRRDRLPAHRRAGRHGARLPLRPGARPVRGLLRRPRASCCWSRRTSSRWSASSEADPRDFRLWVCLHEVTHRTQFTAVPWMRGHFLGEVQAFVDASQAGGEHFTRPAAPGRGDAVRLDPQPGQPGVACSTSCRRPAQRAVLDRLTALMTLLEGHAEFVMDGVGPEVIPSVERIRAKFNRRRESGNPLEKAIRQLLGVDVKMRQYAEGRKFVHGVVDRVGMDGFNRVFSSPLTLPRLEELADPDAWVTRVHGSAGPMPAAG